MKQLLTLQEATDTFLSYSPVHMEREYKLERMRQLMAFLGNPQDRLRIIHIAGTSGKTSTAYFIRGLLEAAGTRTGLTVSPHIIGINERVQIGGIPLDEQQFLAYANQFFGLLAQSSLQPTYFELLVALAYWVFAAEKVDYAVVETGLGGLLDGTNVVSRPDKVCVITDIGLDHTEILGETLPEIAAQKAGIIQAHNHVLMTSQNSAVIDVIRQAADTQRATIEVVTAQKGPTNLPTFQQHNWTLATAVFEYVKTRDILPDLANSQLLDVQHQTPPGRYEQYQYNDKTIILDGAHNPQKLQALSDSLAAAGIHSAAIVANFASAPTAKITAALHVLQPLAHRLIVPEFKVRQDIKNRHSLASKQLAREAQAMGFRRVT
ncbi:MAG TPA: Mur ligase family protein, partial [Candidatus Saccharimonadales bacterium]|nr:Mur ligase family protein [Candidatus Saccharimonadales bacterium]